MLLTIPLGLVLGSWVSGVIGAFFVLTRPRRRVGKLPFIIFSYVVIGTVSISTLYLLLYSLDYMGFSRGPEGDASLCAYIFSLACGVFLIGRAEMKWRKAVGLLRDPQKD
jgi:predicted membrane channel-forming protein YqfA (hemolysin III family)